MLHPVSSLLLAFSVYNNNHATEASSLINKPKVRVYFRRVVYSGLFIGMNLLSEVTAVHLFNSLG